MDVNVGVFVWALHVTRAKNSGWPGLAIAATVLLINDKISCYLGYIYVKSRDPE